MSAHQDHEYHLVDPSPWPLVAAFGFFALAGSSAFYFHGMPNAEFGVLGGLGLLLFVAYRWWSDTIYEGTKHHSAPVQIGMRIGMGLFILSEVMFFFAFFFSFFHNAFLPMEILDGNTWPMKEGTYPPEGQKIVHAWGLPLFNTLLLLMSGTTVTWAHAALLQGNRKDLRTGLLCTIILGLTFTGVQAYEYKHILHELFKFGGNSFSSNFFMATGFHGLHVIIGTIFLIVCYIRAGRGGHLSEKHHLGFEFAAWYWHFVDVVWLFLFTFVYAWSGWGH